MQRCYISTSLIIDARFDYFMRREFASRPLGYATPLPLPYADTSMPLIYEGADAADADLLALRVDVTC